MKINLISYAKVAGVACEPRFRDKGRGGNETGGAAPGHFTQDSGHDKREGMSRKKGWEEVLQTRQSHFITEKQEQEVHLHLRLSLKCAQASEGARASGKGELPEFLKDKHS